MKGATVRLIVYEPSDWGHGNLFGSIIGDRGGNMLLVEADSALVRLTSNLIEFRPRNAKASFEPLMQNYSVMVDGTFVDQDGNKLDYSIYGSITID